MEYSTAVHESVAEETEFSDLFLLSEDLLEVEVVVLSELNELGSDEVGGGSSHDVISVDGSGKLKLGPLSVHLIYC